MIDAFGTIALVAMTPTVSIQIVGIIYKIKLSRSKAAAEDTDILIIESLGNEYIDSSAEVVDVKLDRSAILSGYEDDIEIIEFSVDYEDLTDDSSHMEAKS